MKKRYIIIPCAAAVSASLILGIYHLSSTDKSVEKQENENKTVTLMSDINERSEIQSMPESSGLIISEDTERIPDETLSTTVQVPHAEVTESSSEGKPSAVPTVSRKPNQTPPPTQGVEDMSCGDTYSDHAPADRGPGHADAVPSAGQESSRPDSELPAGPAPSSEPAKPSSKPSVKPAVSETEPSEPAHPSAKPTAAPVTTEDREPDEPLDKFIWNYYKNALVMETAGCGLTNKLVMQNYGACFCYAETPSYIRIEPEQGTELSYDEIRNSLDSEGVSFSDIVKEEDSDAWRIFYSSDYSAVCDVFRNSEKIVSADRYYNVISYINFSVEGMYLHDCDNPEKLAGRYPELQFGVQEKTDAGSYWKYYFPCTVSNTEEVYNALSKLNSESEFMLKISVGENPGGPNSSCETENLFRR